MRAVERGRSFPAYAYDFVGQKGEVFCFLNMILEVCLSIVLRAKDSKEFVTINKYSALPYGVGDLSGFDYGKLLVVVEGHKDREALRCIYPYVVAIGTSNVSKNMAYVLSTLTNKVFLLLDNDQAGKDGAKAAVWKLRKHKVDAVVGEQYSKYKDTGSIADNYAAGNTIDAQMAEQYYGLQIKSYGGQA
jgi:5S rRNA maturation endonuclease (ribonuclease M5)